MPDPGDAPVRDLRSFLAVADELSFTRAAELLFVSQPALSKQVRALEARLGTALFARGHRSIALTDAGTALVPRARRIVAEWEEAVADVRAAAGVVDRTLVVGFHTRIARGLVPAVTAALEERLPGWRPFVAPPASAGPMRDLWLATDHRTSPPRIGAEAGTADEAFEAVAAGLGVALLAAGNAAPYRRDDVVCRPVPDLPPGELAVLWRADDRRRAVEVVTGACFCAVSVDPVSGP